MDGIQKEGEKQKRAEAPSFPLYVQIFLPISRSPVFVSGYLPLNENTPILSMSAGV